MTRWDLQWITGQKHQGHKIMNFFKPVITCHINCFTYTIVITLHITEICKPFCYNSVFLSCLQNHIFLFYKTLWTQGLCTVIDRPHCKDYADVLPEKPLIDRTLAGANISVSQTILGVGFTFHLNIVSSGNMFNWSFLSKSLMAILSTRYISALTRLILICSNWSKCTPFLDFIPSSLTLILVSKNVWNLHRSLQLVSDECNI